MQKFVITKAGTARVGATYPHRVHHKETGTVHFFKDLWKAGLLDIGLWRQPFEDNTALWAATDYEPIYREPAAIAAKYHTDDRAVMTGGVRFIAAAAVPPQRSVAMRDAWEDDGSKITVNMVKARAGKTEEIRPERNKRLLALDVEHRKASGNTTEQDRIDAVAQKLRHLPATIQPDLDAIATPEALEAWEPNWPE